MLQVSYAWNPIDYVWDGASDDDQLQNCSHWAGVLGNPAIKQSDTIICVTVLHLTKCNTNSNVMSAWQTINTLSGRGLSPGHNLVHTLVSANMAAVLTVMPWTTTDEFNIVLKTQRMCLTYYPLPISIACTMSSRISTNALTMDSSLPCIFHIPSCRQNNLIAWKGRPRCLHLKTKRAVKLIIIIIIIPNSLFSISWVTLVLICYLPRLQNASR